MSRRPSTAAALVALAATLMVACTGGGSGPSPDPEPVPVKIAFLHDTSIPGSTQTQGPALLGMQLAFQDAIERGDLPVIPEMVDLDVEGDDARARDLAQQVVDDPSYVAAVIGPFWSETGSVGDLLDAAGIATLSLSELDPALATRGWSSWRRVVAGVALESAAIASAATRGPSRSNDGTCVVGDGSAPSRVLGDLLATDLGLGAVVASAVLPDEDALPNVIQRIVGAGCGTVVWTGFAPGATLLRSGLTAAGARSVALVGSSAMKTDPYLSTTAGDGTIVTCACVDLGSSTRPEARRFIHDFQSRYGSPPGVFGPEGWDVGGMLLGAFRSGAMDRRTVAAALTASREYEGLANTYRFNDDGELASGATVVHVFRAEGVRWVPAGEVEAEEPLPVGTPGALSVATCRTGRPHAYRVGGRLQGFGAELTEAIARRLGLTLSWRDLSCRAALHAVADGTLDTVLAPAAEAPQGAPTTGVALSVHAALVALKEQARPEAGATVLDRLGPHDVVTVVRSPELSAWAKTTLASTGAEVGLTANRTSAYEALVAGAVTVVVDLEPDAWAAIERRHSLRVAQSIDVGAHDVFVAAGPNARLAAAIDGALLRLIRAGRYALLFAKYFPGSPIPAETGR